MNQFATSDSAVVKAPENTGGNAAILEAFSPTDKARPTTNEQISAQTENLVNSGVLPDMPIDGLFDQAPLQQVHETASVRKPSRFDYLSPESGEIALENITEGTVERGLELAELIESGGNEGRIVDLVKQGLVNGDLEGTIRIANLALQKSEDPNNISLGLVNEKMTYEFAQDESAVKPPGDSIEQYNQRAAVSITRDGESVPWFSFQVKYDPAIDGYNAPYPSVK